MASYEVEIARLRDRDLFSFWRNAAEILGAGSFTITEIGGHSQSYASADPDAMSNAYLAKSGLLTIVSSHLSSNLGLSVVIERRSSDTFTDRLVINTSSQQSRHSAEVVRSLNELISRTFSLEVLNSNVFFGGEKAVSQLIKSHQQMLAQLQSSATSITETIATAHAKLEEEFAKRTAQLDEDFQARTTKADEALDSERRALREREDAVAQRNRDLDDRDNTTARRAQHATLKSRITERGKSFVITPETRKARLPIHIACVAAMIGVLVFLYRYSTALAELPVGASWALVIAATVKPIGLTLALLGLVAWYLRWMNRWFERHADTEFYLKQFELDIDRANWVVETALEWKEKQERVIPDALLESISCNLFTKSEKDDDANMHPADYLASAILGSASNVNLKVPGGEISLTNKGIKKLQQQENA